MPLSNTFLRSRPLHTLVENRTTYNSSHAEMHVFETHQQASSVLLQFNQPIVASMLSGKKIMHLQNRQSFDFLPGQTLTLPSDEVMCIDFPKATMDTPTQCLAMAIAEDKVRTVIQLMNETMSKAEQQEWDGNNYQFHFTNDMAIHQIVQRLLYYFTEGHTCKDLFISMAIRELIIRTVQLDNEAEYKNKAIELSSSNPIAAVIDYIRKNLDHPLKVEQLSQKAYMSESNFHRVFKNELGVSPVEYINNERIRLAASLLRNPKKKIKEIYMECGFNSISYFTRTFKRKYQVSPSEFQSQISKNRLKSKIIQ